MKKILLFSLLGCLFFATALQAQDEEIQDFSVTIDIESSGTVKVEEKITYDFGFNEKHGIFREIPYRYKARGGIFELRINDIEVFDAQGNAIEHTTNRDEGNLVIKIGDSQKFVTGQQIYRINYSVKRAINFFDDHDELYWNVTGDNWPVVIKQSKVEVNLPGISDEDKTKAECFSGVLGSTIRCISHRYIYSRKAQVKSISFIEDKLTPGQGFTIVAGWEKGQVEEPGYASIVTDTVRDNLILGLPILTLLIMLWLWQKFGRDPRARGVIIAEYDAPDNLSPSEIGTVLDEKVHNHDISAELIELAVRGYVGIKKERKEGLLGGSDYELTRVKAADNGLEKHQAYLLEKIFSKKFCVNKTDDSRVVRLSKIKLHFAEHIKETKNKVYTSVISKGYFSKSPAKVRGKYTVLGVVALVGAWFVGPLLDWLGVISVALSGLIVLAFSFVMPRKTLKGVRLQEKILGFKNYLQVAEKDRIDFHSNPKKNPKTFEKFLPYAIALRVEKEWAKQFEDVYNENPDWYFDSSRGSFSALAFSDSMNDFGKTARVAMTAVKSSASSGGSGFSGGSSGGGFSGGGGGSW